MSLISKPSPENPVLLLLPKPSLDDERFFFALMNDVFLLVLTLSVLLLELSTFDFTDLGVCLNELTFEL